MSTNKWAIDDAQSRYSSMKIMSILIGRLEFSLLSGTVSKLYEGDSAMRLRAQLVFMKNRLIIACLKGYLGYLWFTRPRELALMLCRRMPANYSARLRTFTVLGAETCNCLFLVSSTENTTGHTYIDRKLFFCFITATSSLM